MSEANGDTCADLAKLKLEQNGGGAGEPAASTTPVNPPVTSSPGPDSIVAPSTPTNSSTPSFAETFRSFAKFGDTKSDGKHITLSQSDKWMKQAKVIDGKKITTTDTGIHFKKLKIMKAPLAEYKKFLEDLAKAKKMEVGELREKMAVCGTPGHTGVGMKTTSTVNRLTDTSKYTGTHKQRFDDSGKGKGISGRKDLPDGAGYVSGYQNKDTFGKAEGNTS